jgi:hypothetical protein
MSTYLPEPVVARLVSENQHQADNDRQTRDDAARKTNVIVTDMIKVDNERRPQRAQDDRKSNVGVDCPFDEAEDKRPYRVVSCELTNLSSLECRAYTNHLRGFLRELLKRGYVGERACILWPAIVVAYRGTVDLQPRGYARCEKCCECLSQG